MYFKDSFIVVTGLFIYFKRLSSTEMETFLQTLVVTVTWGTSRHRRVWIL